MIHVANEADLKGVNILKGNVLADLEKEVGVEIVPDEFAKKANITISAGNTRSILKEMGDELPDKIYGKDQLDNILKNTPRLTPEETKIFVEKANILN